MCSSVRALTVHCFIICIIAISVVLMVLRTGRVMRIPLVQPNIMMQRGWRFDIVSVVRDDQARFGWNARELRVDGDRRERSAQRAPHAYVRVG